MNLKLIKQTKDIRASIMRVDMLFYELRGIIRKIEMMEDIINTHFYRGSEIVQTTQMIEYMKMYKQLDEVNNNYKFKSVQLSNNITYAYSKIFSLIDIQINNIEKDKINIDIDLLHSLSMLNNIIHENFPSTNKIPLLLSSIIPLMAKVESQILANEKTIQTTTRLKMQIDKLKELILEKI